MQDGELAQHARQGDLDAYEALLRCHQQDAQRASFLVLRQREEAEDAVQEAFVRAWDRIDQFDARRDFRPWLLKIVTNEARDRLRARGRRRRLKLRAIREMDTKKAVPSPERSVVTSERVGAVIEEINGMDEDDQTIMSYRYFLDLPTAEIADLLDMPHGTVRSRISRARQRLRERLAGTDQPGTDTT